MAGQRIRTGWIVGGILAGSATVAGVGLAAAQSPVPSPSSYPDEALVLRGIISGRNEGPDRQYATDAASQAVLDVTLTFTPGRMTALGTAEVSGEFSGDCQFAHEEALPVSWDSNPPDDQAPPTPSTAQTSSRPGYVSIQAQTFEPLGADEAGTSFYLSVGAGTGGEGGMCGYLTGHVVDITTYDAPLRVDVLGCMVFEVIGTGDAWHGSCAETRGATNVSWNADLAQVWP